MTANKKKTYFLTGDVGGTNSRMSFYVFDETVNGKEKLVHEYIYRNAHHIPDVPTDTSYQHCIIKPFLKECFQKLKIDDTTTGTTIVSCLACAGPVMNNAVRMSNLNNCLIDGNAIAENIPFMDKCIVINDFVAQGYGCLTLQIDEVKHLYGPKYSTTEQLQKGVSDKSPKVCVGAGTGLGECFLTPDSRGGNYTCYPSEGGHVEYCPPTDETEYEMFKYLRDSKFDVERKTRISVERIVSGPGLSNIYESLMKQFPDEINSKIRDEFMKAGDMAPKVIAINAENDPLCKKAMDIMMSAYGCEVGNVAIKYIPMGGLFVTGGLTPKNIHHIEPKDSKFLQFYQHKGRVSGVLEYIPTYAVMVEDLGIRGVLHCAKMTYERNRQQKPSNSSSEKSKTTTKLILGCTITGVLAFAVGFFCNKNHSHRHK